MLKQWFFYGLGLAVLLINKIRYSLLGYQRPRDFPSTAINQAITYDVSVVNNWLNTLTEYAGVGVVNKTVLELGPGADLGVALILLSKGSKKYSAVDVNNLNKNVPAIFYEKLLAQLGKPELSSALQNKNKINYIWDSNFNLAQLSSTDCDIVVSQAAFEHFTNPEQALTHLSRVVKSGAMLIAEIDLQTHTRWLRTQDPLNIYRYSETVYKWGYFSGLPNRVRPLAYEKVLEQNGWTNIRVIPKNTTNQAELQRYQALLAKPFRNKAAQMEILSFVLCATKK
ncbi:MAG: methyltransferase domain-containing protein [Patescibacteria group bacterium]|jgi:ubiquinone/menaquinone biosynthesis C-methylase UbiE